jgi:hypothetical protein
MGQTDLFGNPIEKPPPDLATCISPEMERYREQLQGYTVDELHKIRKSLGFGFKKGQKDALVSATLGFLSLVEQQFEEWFASLPAYLSSALKEATFKGFVDAGTVEASAGKPVSKGNRSYYYDYHSLNPDLRLGMFDLYRKHDRTLLMLQPLFRRLLSSWLPTPAGYSVAPCAEQDLTGWSAANALSESMPLLLKSLERVLADEETCEKVLRRGLNKTTIKDLRKSSAYPSFPLAGKLGMDPIELIARFVMIDPDQLDVVRTEDIRDVIRGFVTGFLTIPESGMVKSYYLLIDSSFEFSALCPHLSRAGRSRRHGSAFHPHPPARSVFREILTSMAESGRWYNVNQVAESIRMQGLPFTIFRSDYGEYEVLLKGEELNLPGGPFVVPGWEDGFKPDPYLSHYLVTIPLLKSYCYLMASLGLLEIDEEEPEKRLGKRGKLTPISPAEALTRVRITGFGAWCLGASTEKPALREVRYEAIADRELPLVTYRGQSLECKVFLERIGDPIGEDRFRITEAGFIRDCTSPADVEERISEFHRLIAKEPAAHWKELFSRVRERARLFQAEEQCVMIKLPDDRELRRVFLEDRKLSSLVIRAEGGRIVVKQHNYKKLRKALEEYGVLKG